MQNQQKVSFCFDRKRTSLVNKGKNMLHKLSLNNMAISYRQAWEYVHTNIFSFRE